MTPSKTSLTDTQQTQQGRTLLIGSGILALVGIISWLVQFIQGMEVLAIGGAVSWGVYIAAFFLLAGIGGGMMVLAAATGFGLLPAFKEKYRSLLVASIACFIAAGFMILMDLGRPERVFNMLLSPNLKSMFVWDFYFLVLSIIVAFIYIIRRQSKPLAGIVAAAAALLIIVEGWILVAGGGGSPLWHSSLIPVIFLIEALIAAIAVVMIAEGRVEDRNSGLSGTLLILLPAALILSILEVVGGSYMSQDSAASLGVLTGGSLSPLYWGQIILGIVLPFVILALKNKSANTVRVAGVLAVVGVFMAKFNLLVAGQALPFMGSEAGYVPTLVELGGVIGGLGLAAFLFILGRNTLSGKMTNADSAGSGKGQGLSSPS